MGLVEYRQELLQVAHKLPVGGHLGVRKTQAKIQKYFYYIKMWLNFAIPVILSDGRKAMDSDKISVFDANSCN